MKKQNNTKQKQKKKKQKRRVNIFQDLNLSKNKSFKWKQGFLFKELHRCLFISKIFVWKYTNKQKGYIQGRFGVEVGWVAEIWNKKLES